MSDKILDLSERRKQVEAEEAFKRQQKMEQFSHVSSFANQIFFNVVSKDFESLSSLDLKKAAGLAYQAARVIVEQFSEELEKEGI
jgi:hypothetical protein